jgi:L-lactate dehydrogenase
VEAQPIAATPSGGSGCLRRMLQSFQDIVPKIHYSAPEALILVVTDPPDALADVVRVLGHERVLSTGTSLDSLRFRFHLAKRLNVSASDVEALVLVR